MWKERWIVQIFDVEAKKRTADTDVDGLRFSVSETMIVKASSQKVQKVEDTTINLEWRYSTFILSANRWK